MHERCRIWCPSMAVMQTLSQPCPQGTQFFRKNSEKTRAQGAGRGRSAPLPFTRSAPRQSLSGLNTRLPSTFASGPRLSSSAGVLRRCPTLPFESPPLPEQLPNPFSLNLPLELPLSPFSNHPLPPFLSWLFQSRSTSRVAPPSTRVAQAKRSTRCIFGSRPECTSASPSVRPRHGCRRAQYQRSVYRPGERWTCS